MVCSGVRHGAPVATSGVRNGALVATSGVRSGTVVAKGQNKSSSSHPSATNGPPGAELGGAAARADMTGALEKDAAKRLPFAHVKTRAALPIRQRTGLFMKPLKPMDCLRFTNRPLDAPKTFDTSHLKPAISSRRRFPISHWRKPMPFSRRPKVPAAASSMTVPLSASIPASTFIGRNVRRSRWHAIGKVFELWQSSILRWH
jgi:hypothetical protein